MNNVIVGMGEALWDCLPEGKKIGGAPANFAYHVSQFGFDSRVVSAVGADADGDEILDVLRKEFAHTDRACALPHRYGTGDTGCRGCALLRHPRRCGVGQHPVYRRVA